MAELSANLVRSFLNMIEKSDYSTGSSSFTNGLPELEKFISVDLQESKFLEIPYTVSTGILDKLLDKSLNKSTLIIPILQKRTESIRSADMIFRKSTEGYGWSHGLVKFTISSKNEVYYSLPGIILDANFNHILYISRRVSLTDLGTRIDESSVNIYLNPSLFSAQDSVSRFIMAKFMPYITKDYAYSDNLEIRVKDMTDKIFKQPKTLNSRGHLGIENVATLIVRRGSKAIANSLW